MSVHFSAGFCIGYPTACKLWRTSDVGLLWGVSDGKLTRGISPVWALGISCFARHSSFLCTNYRSMNYITREYDFWAKEILEKRQKYKTWPCAILADTGNACHTWFWRSCVDLSNDILCMQIACVVHELLHALAWARVWQDFSPFQPG